MQRRKSSVASPEQLNKHSKESLMLLVNSLKDLDGKLPEQFANLGFTNPEALIACIENNPIAWHAYFESKNAKAPIPLEAIKDTKTREYIQSRNRILTTLSGHCHAAFKLDNETLLQIDPMIAAMEKENRRLDNEAIKQVNSEIAQLESNIKTAIVGFSGRTWPNKDKPRTQTYTKLLDKIETARKAGDVELCRIYEKRRDTFQSGEEYQRCSQNIAEKKQEKKVLEYYTLTPEGKTLNHDLTALTTARITAQQNRNLALSDKKIQKQTLPKEIVRNNPLVLRINLLLLSMLQDLLMLGAITVDLWTELETILREDLEAFNAGTFVFGDKKAAGKLPPHMLQHPFYMKLFDIYRRDPNNFRENIKTQLFDVNGKLIPVDYTALLAVYPLSSDKAKNTPEAAHQAIAAFNVEGYVEPISDFFKQSTVARLFMKIDEIAPKDMSDKKISYKGFVKESEELGTPLNIVIAGCGETISATRDYLETVLAFSICDPGTLSNFVKKDETNPLRRILKRHNLPQESHFESREYITLETHIKALTTDNFSPTASNINAALNVLTYFKKMLGIETKIKIDFTTVEVEGTDKIKLTITELRKEIIIAKELARNEQEALVLRTFIKEKTGIDIDTTLPDDKQRKAALRAYIENRQLNRKETEVDVVFIKCFFDRIAAMIFQFTEQTQKNKADEEKQASTGKITTAEKKKLKEETCNNTSLLQISKPTEGAKVTNTIDREVEWPHRQQATIVREQLKDKNAKELRNGTLRRPSVLDHSPSQNGTLTPVSSSLSTSPMVTPTAAATATSKPAPPPSQPKPIFTAPSADAASPNANSKLSGTTVTSPKPANTDNASVDSRTPTPVSTPVQTPGSIVGDHSGFGPNAEKASQQQPASSPTQVPAGEKPAAPPPRNRAENADSTSHGESNTDGTPSPKAPTAAAPEPDKTSTEKRVGAPSFLAGLDAAKLKPLSNEALKKQKQKEDALASKLGSVVENTSTNSKDASNSSSSTPAAPSQSTVPTSGAFNLTDAIAKKQAEMAARKGSTTSGDTAIQQIRRASDAGAPKPVTPPGETAAPAPVLSNKIATSPSATPVDEVSAKDESGSEKPKASTPTNPSSADKGFNEALLVQAQVTAKFKNARGENDSDSDSDSDADSEDWNHSTTVPQQAREPKLGKPSITGTFGSSGKRNQTANSGSKPKLGN